MSEIRTHEQVAGIIGILCEEVANDVEMGAEERGDATRRAIEWLTATDAALRAEVERLRALLREVAEGGVESADERVRYVTVQIDRDTWAAVQEEARRG